MKNYLSGRTHRTNMNDSYSSILDLIIGVSQGSVLVPSLFNVCICDPFFFMEENTVTSYVNDTTHFSYGTNTLTVVSDIENKVSNVFDWFSKKLP